MSSSAPVALALGWLICLSSGLSIVGCRVTQGEPGPEVRAPVAASAAVSKSPPVATPQNAGPHVELPAGVDWQTWTDGLSSARSQGRPIMLLVYAHWCQQCKALAPVFADPAVKALSAQLVMVEQNADDRPSWLEETFSGVTRDYVPRIFFVRPDGTVREDIKSGHPKYPYFYSAAGVEELKAAMRKAISG